MQQGVIVGAGHAGFQCCAALRQEGFEGSIVLVGDEPGLPYQRPPLSKAYLLGTSNAVDLHFRTAQFFDDQRVQRIGGRVEAIDRAAQRVVLQSGQTVAYDHLVIATGSSPRRLRVEGADLGGVLGLQTLADADRLRAGLASSRRAVVIGAGFIGLEFAAVARSLGVEVTVLDVADRVLARAATPPVARAVAASHAGRGTMLRFGCAASALEGRDGRVAAVHTAQGEVLPADLVVVGIGAEPRTQLAAQAGLAIDGGIRVDARLVTDDPAISAIGDVASFPDPLTGRHIRLESVQNAGDQARSVAARLAGREVAHGPVPWFWSDQGELKLQIAGLAAPGDTQVVLEEPVPSKAMTVLSLRGGRLAAVETLNRAGDHMLARRLLARGVSIGEDEARAPGFQLRSLA